MRAACATSRWSPSLSPRPSTTPPDARVPVGEVVAVYDLGGGTFDAAVLRRTANGLRDARRAGRPRATGWHRLRPRRRGPRRAVDRRHAADVGSQRPGGRRRADPSAPRVRDGEGRALGGQRGRRAGRPARRVVGGPPHPWRVRADDRPGADRAAAGVPPRRRVRRRSAPPTSTRCCSSAAPHGCRSWPRRSLASWVGPSPSTPIPSTPSPSVRRGSSGPRRRRPSRRGGERLPSTVTPAVRRRRDPDSRAAPSPAAARTAHRPPAPATPSDGLRRRRRGGRRSLPAWPRS